MTVFVGTSGWQYRHWPGRFYPEGLAPSSWLAHYADRFSTVEVNASFYRLPDGATVERWAATVPPGFVFAFKASRYLTHIRRLRDGSEPLERLHGVVAGAGPKLGPVLFQLPPTLRRDDGLLHEFLELLPREPRSAFSPPPLVVLRAGPRGARRLRRRARARRPAGCPGGRAGGGRLVVPAVPRGQACGSQVPAVQTPSLCRRHRRGGLTRRLRVLQQRCGGSCLGRRGRADRTPRGATDPGRGPRCRAARPR